MNELLGNPAVQGGVAPLLAGLLVAASLRGTRLGALAIVAAFAAAVALSIGWSLEPMGASRKLSLVGVGAAAVVLVVELTGRSARLPLRAVLAGLAGVATLWVLFGVLRQKAPTAAVIAGASAALFVAALVDAGHAAGAQPVRATAAALMLGLAAGALALRGASALLALFGIAVGAGAGAVLLVQMIGGRRFAAGWTLALPACLVVGLVAVMASLTGGLRWFVVLPLLGVPWAARLVPARALPVWLEAVLASLAAALPAAAAVAWAWFGAGIAYS